MTATDKNGTPGSTSLILTASDVLPVATATGPTAGNQGVPVTLTGSATDALPADAAAGFTFTWSVTKNGSGVFATAPGPPSAIRPIQREHTCPRLRPPTRNGGAGLATTTDYVVGNIVSPGSGHFEIRSSGTPGNANDVLQLLLNGTVIQSTVASTVVGWTINGTGTADSLLVNYGYTGGFFNVPVQFNEDAGGTGTLSIAGGSFSTVTQDYSTPATGLAKKGTITYNDTTSAFGTDAITYTGITTVNMAATTNTDGSTPQPGMSTISSLLFKLPATVANGVLANGTQSYGVAQNRQRRAGPLPPRNSLLPAR